MKYHLVLLCLAVVTTSLIDTVYADPKVEISAPNYNNATRILHFTPNSKIELKCSVSDDAEIQWRRGDKPITNQLDKRYTVTNQTGASTFTIAEPRDSDHGEYKCVALKDGKVEASSEVKVEPQIIHIKVPRTVNAVEGENATIECSVWGGLEVHWEFVNFTDGNTTSYYYDEKPRDERVTLKEEKDEGHDPRKHEFKISNVQLTDRGDFVCIGSLKGEQVRNGTVTLRIKDRYAALWPFLGICAEVIVLCAVIFIYEKKRNKTELEESDTDQSPDQKNTPDHGKEANLRHRQ